MMNKNDDECLSIQFVFAEYRTMSGFWAAKRQPEAEIEAAIEAVARSGKKQKNRLTGQGVRVAGSSMLPVSVDCGQNTLGTVRFDRPKRDLQANARLNSYLFFKEAGLFPSRINCMCLSS